ncbi:C40 family peptidase [Saccharibacillus alkalitolerans]|uniref:SH3 domain-containing protein n=1 Tax=Saccharibacillus alkalitolerans TaxID=2705290 RepID=A0ABX0F9U2_9BACL|nr:C40 family peptidase [Saccharibacillus alkalitolerans]NGZ76244.1 SH3 domain-containing protein [Saccharibacillus alkalitolerans]
MNRKLFSLVAASSLLVTVPAVAQASPGKVDRPVNLRSAPSASEGSVYRTLQPGTKLEVVTELNNYWLKVQIGEKTGYVSSSYVTYTKESSPSVKAASSGGKTSSGTNKASKASSTSSVKQAAASSAPSAVKTLIEPPAPAAAPAPAASAAGSGVVTKNVNFRTAPVTGSDVLRVLSAGETFTAVELANSAWLKITDASGVTGYVSTGYVSYALPDGGSSSSSQIPSSSAPLPAADIPAVPSLPPVPSEPSAPSPGFPIGTVISPDTADRVINNALSLQGITRYGFGKNEAPVLFDCSSFTRYVFGLEGISLPLGTAYQKDIGIPVEKGEWQKGDLLFFWSSVPGLIGHVGIYDGEGHLVHNSASKDGVAVADLDLKYWQDHYVSARRVLQ